MLTEEKRRELERFSADIRIQTIRQLAKRGFGHVGGSMSIADLLSVLYGGIMRYDPQNPRLEDRDWLVCSKGHAGPALYSTLALSGFFPMEWLETLNQPGTSLPSHCDRLKTPGIDMSTGSLGQGLSVAAGVALAKKNDGAGSRVYCITGDGECQEGQIWEAVLFAAQYRLDNLVLLVDFNKEQLDGPVERVNALESFSEKLAAFQWNAAEINGHDHAAIHDALENAGKCRGRPSAIVLHTVKGKGCSFAEGKFCHHINVGKEEAEAAIGVLENQKAVMGL